MGKFIPKSWVLGAVGAMVALGFAVAGIAWAQDFAAASAGASVKITSPADGAKVRSPFKVTLTVSGIAVEPAGPPKAGTGHHHLIIDGGPMKEGTVVPADGSHLHYGKGQTEAELNLAPGPHTITAQFADGLHRSYGPGLSSTIKVMVEY